MEVLLRRSREVLSTARTIHRSSGLLGQGGHRRQIHVLPEASGLLGQGGHRRQLHVLPEARSIHRSSGLLGQGGHRRQLHVLPEGQRIWVPESLNGTSACGMNGERFFVDSEVGGVIEYFKSSPLLHSVPKDRLFNPNLVYPHFTEDDGNQFILSGINLIDSMHGCNLSTKGLFTKENVVMFPRTMALGFKELNAEGVIVPGGANQLPIMDRVENYEEYVVFLEDVIEQSQGPLALQLLPPLFKGIGILANKMIADKNIVQVLRSYPALMPLQSKAVYYRRVYNIMERLQFVIGHNLPAAGLVPSGKAADVQALFTKLLKSIPYTTVGHDLWGDMAIHNFEVFNVFVSLAAMKKNDPIGLVRMLRVIASHPFGLHMVKLIKEFDQVEKDVKANNYLNWRARGLAARACSSTLQTIPPTCREVLRLTDQTYSAYPTEVAIGFSACGVYHWLDMPGLMRSRQ